MIKEINDSDTLEEYLENSEVPTVVLYHADWCQPCQKFKPQFKLSAAINRDYAHVSANIDMLGPDYIQENGIMQVPTVVLYEQGRSIRLKSRTAAKLTEELAE